MTPVLCRHCSWMEATGPKYSAVKIQGLLYRMSHKPAVEDHRHRLCDSFQLLNDMEYSLKLKKIYKKMKWHVLSLFESQCHWLRKSCHPQHMFLDKIALSFPDYQKCFHSNDSSRVLFHSKSLRGTLTPTQQTKQTVIKKSPSQRPQQIHIQYSHTADSLSLFIRWNECLSRSIQR